MDRSDSDRIDHADHFVSVLSPWDKGVADDRAPAIPDFFHDLNLDRIIDGVVAPWGDYDLTPFFSVSLDHPDQVVYRQEVMRDMECPSVASVIGDFSSRMRAMREYSAQAEKRYYKEEKERFVLAAAELYIEAVQKLEADLDIPEVASRGLRGLRQYLAGYVRSEAFITLKTSTLRLTEKLAAVRYSLLIKDSTITVSGPTDEIDYSVAVEQSFEKFRRWPSRQHALEKRRQWGMNDVEARILQNVALLNPDTFRLLEEFCLANTNFVDHVLARFDREIIFYVAYLKHIEPLRSAGLNFCYPEILKTSKEIMANGVFDLALAPRLVKERIAIVCNDFYLRNPERVFVVSGPNQGGKTTFARTFGQLHYLAALGCPIPGTQAKLFLFDRLFTHFEKDEDITNLRGKLQDDLVRIHGILEAATPESLIILNEIFSSTTLTDAVYLSKQIMAKITDLDVLGVCVSFLSELASFNEKIVSAMSTIDPDDPAIRTYKVQRKPADGRAYALAIAEKYRVTHDALKERIKS